MMDFLPSALETTYHYFSEVVAHFVWANSAASPERDAVEGTAGRLAYAAGEVADSARFSVDNNGRAPWKTTWSSVPTPTS